MQNLRVAPIPLCALSCALVACLHDFDTFESTADGTGDEAGVADAALLDAGSGPGDAAPPIDSGAVRDTGADSAPTCADPGAIVYAGHCYFPTAAMASWDTSRTTCIAAGAHLATLTTSAEQSAVQAIDSSLERWIGLSRPVGSPSVDGSFVWVDGEPRGGYSDWIAGEPNGSGECARMKTTGQWADDVCATSHTAICERE